ncbi:MAG: hypothetical protein JWR03_2364, partial [Cohnella sp.]|nr:hypothetical protein [Cohnella sp.]
DHTAPGGQAHGSLSDEDLAEWLHRLQTVKAAEITCGIHIQPSDPVLTNGPALLRKGRKLSRRCFRCIAWQPAPCNAKGLSRTIVRDNPFALAKTSLEHGYFAYLHPMCPQSSSVTRLFRVSRPYVPAIVPRYAAFPRIFVSYPSSHTVFAEPGDRLLCGASMSGYPTKMNPTTSSPGSNFSARAVAG